MRNAIFVAVALATCSLFGFAPRQALASPVSINLVACTPSASTHKCTASTTYTDSASGITFAGWEFDGENGWEPANLTYKDESAGETGLGVECTYDTTGPKCSQDEINTTPAQYISVDISGISFDKLTIGTGSDDSDGNSADSAVPEATYIWGASCDDADNCTDQTLLASHSGADGYPNNVFSWTFSAATLSHFDFLYVTPLCFTGSPGSPESCPDAPDANILLSSLSFYTSVPEPGTLGLFGLGIALLGGFAGLRRCKQH